MAWPTSNVSLANVDSGSDSVSSARGDIYSAFVKLNEVITNGPGTGNVTVYNNDNVATYLPTHTGNVSANYFIGNGSKLTGITIGSTYGNTEVATFLPVYSGNITANVATFTKAAVTSTLTLGPYVETVYTGGNTGAGTVTPTMSNGPVQKFTATGNFTLALPSGMTSGSSIVLIIRQDATGTRTCSIHASYKFSGGSKTLSTAANSIDIITIFYDGTDYLCNLIKAYA
jgi:hypothetical protein